MIVAIVLASIVFLAVLITFAVMNEPGVGSCIGTPVLLGGIAAIALSVGNYAMSGSAVSARCGQCGASGARHNHRKTHIVGRRRQ